MKGVRAALGGSVGIPQHVLVQGKPNRVLLFQPVAACELEGWVAYLDEFPKRRFAFNDILPAGKILELRPEVAP